MKIEVKQPALKEGLKVVSQALSNNTTLPILKFIKLTAEDGKLLLEATDLELGIEMHIKAKVLEEGSIAVPGKKFKSYVGKVAKTKPVSLIAHSNDNLELTCGASNTIFNGSPGDEYVDTPSFNKEGIKIDGGKIAGMLDKNTFACSDDESKPFLNGVYVKTKENGIDLAATDTYKMTHVNDQIELDKEIDFILPTNAADVLSKELTGEVEFIKQDNLVKFQDENKIITSRLINGDFPNYERVIPDDNNIVFKTESQLLKDAIDRVMIATEKNIVNMQLEDEEFKLKGTKNDNAKSVESLECDVKQGEELVMSFNGNFVMEYLKHIEGEVVIKSNGGETPMLMHTKDDNSYKFVVMPVRGQ